MWLKFDGKKCIIKLSDWDANKKKEVSFTVNKWVHIVEAGGKLYINGKE